MIELSLLLLVGAVIFYILRVLFNSEEFNWLTLVLSVSTVASVISDTDIAKDTVVYYIVPMLYIIMMSVVYIIYGGRKA